MVLGFDTNDAQRALDKQQQLDWLRGWQVVNPSGGSNLVTAGTNAYELDVAAGDVNLGGTTVSATAQTIDVQTAVSSSGARMAVVYRDSNGDAQYIAGETTDIAPTGASVRGAYNPTPSTTRTIDGTVLAEVLLPEGATEITASEIRDRRLPASLNVVDLDITNAETDHVWFDKRSSIPTDSEIGTGNVALYIKTDDNVYKRPYGGSESQIGGGEGYATLAPLAAELQSGSAVSKGVPVPSGQKLDVISWGVRTSAGTTPTGLKAQLTQIDGTVIAEENTAYNGSSTASVSNSGTSPVWYNLRIKNETGTDYIDGQTPDSVLGNFVYDLGSI